MSQDNFTLEVIRGPKKVGKNMFKYPSVKYDAKGWADTQHYYPADYDMCYLKMATGEIKKGWWGGYGWDGARVLKNDMVIGWKRQV